MLYIKKGCDFILQMEFGYDITNKNILITCKSILDTREDNNEAIFIEDIAVPSSTPEEIQDAIDGIYVFKISNTVTQDYKITDCIFQVELKDSSNNSIQDMGQDTLKIINNIRKQ